MTAPVSATASRSSTSTSLLERAKAHDEDAWARLVKLYAPLVYRECRVMDVSPQDAADIVQDVFRKVAAGLGQFRQDRPGDSFRAWLATIARNTIRDHFRKAVRHVAAVGGSEMHRVIQALPDEDRLESTISIEPDANAAVVQRAIQEIRDEFESHTWQAFWRTAVDAAAPADVAAELGVSKWVVYQAKSRVLRRLRQELQGLVE
jgi:RNA polymerase sigma-70 factor (ECF subfamily)